MVLKVHRIENYILLQSFVLWCTRKPTFFKLHERIVQEKKFILNLNIDSILRISADYRTKCKRQKDLSYSHIYSHTYTQMQIYEWFYICWYIVCIQTDMVAIFPFYNMKKIKWRYFFYPIYIWFNNKLLVVSLIYLGYLKKDIDVPFSFFFSPYSVKRVLMLPYWVPFTF